MYSSFQRSLWDWMDILGPRYPIRGAVNAAFCGTPGEPRSWQEAAARLAPRQTGKGARAVLMLAALEASAKRWSAK
jgi:hypothetical protein